jgi:hypothetical protein
MTHAFFATKPITKKATSSPLADEAVAIFGKKFPFDRPPVQVSPLTRVGMPYADIDGTILSKGGNGKRLTDISPDQARAAFNELARLYGDKEALGMIKALPVALTFGKTKFAPTLKALSEKFGEEKAKAAVIRNPGLLAIKPDDAASANEQTLVFSYLVGFTRPLGPVLLPALLIALFSPAIEATTGIPIRSTFLSLFN